MHEIKLIEVTGLANAAYLRNVVLPDCERRATQRQALTTRFDGAQRPARPRRRFTVWQRGWKRWMSRTPNQPPSHT
jgi:hypothetical protein